MYCSGSARPRRETAASLCWEPFIEPWPCFLTWQQQAAGRLHPSRLKMGIHAKQRLDINVTSVLLEQYSLTKSSWLADDCKKEEQPPQALAALSWMGSSVDPLASDRGLFDGAEVVLGQAAGLLELGPEQQFINQKMRPGSGVLSVHVLPDGPTRVPQISDFNQRRINRTSPSTEEDQNKDNVQIPEQELEVLVDNQLLGTTQLVMLCVSLGSSSDSNIVDTGAALQVNSVKVPSSLMLTDIFKNIDDEDG
ncbi:hypothetical protein J4Q44_G00211500 [Coregonus suidteri]|uniref:Uncharacterized protein n=1 Tax=Coregonus suidteri TaxID=861788 RepID=A0AAN8QJ81_9TELE